MTSAERQNLRQALLRLPEVALGSPEYRHLEIMAGESFDGAYERIENGGGPEN